jgi:hypothetical protein
MIRALGTLPFSAPSSFSAPCARRFDRVLEHHGLHVVQTPFQAPNANAYAERFVRSIKQGCLGGVIPLGE